MVLKNSDGEKSEENLVLIQQVYVDGAAGSAEVVLDVPEASTISLDLSKKTAEKHGLNVEYWFQSEDSFGIYGGDTESETSNVGDDGAATDDEENEDDFNEMFNEMHSKPTRVEIRAGHRTVSVFLGCKTLESDTSKRNDFVTLEGTILVEGKRFSKRLRLVAQVCRSILECDASQLALYDCLPTKRYYKEFTVWNRSEIPLGFRCVSLNPDAISMEVQEESNYREASRKVTVPGYSHIRVRVSYTPKRVGDFKYHLFIENVNNPSNSECISVHTSVTIEPENTHLFLVRDTVDSESELRAVKFDDCLLGSLVSKRLRVKNTTNREMECDLSSSSPYVSFAFEDDTPKRFSTGLLEASQERRSSRSGASMLAEIKEVSESGTEKVEEGRRATPPHIEEFAKNLRQRRQSNSQFSVEDDQDGSRSTPSMEEGTGGLVDDSHTEDMVDTEDGFSEEGLRTDDEQGDEHDEHTGEVGAGEGEGGEAIDEEDEEEDDEEEEEEEEEEEATQAGARSDMQSSRRQSGSRRIDHIDSNHTAPSKSTTMYLGPGMEKTVTVLYRPGPIEVSQDNDHRRKSHAYQLRRRDFLLHLSSMTIPASARVCKNGIRLSTHELNFGDCNIGVPKTKSILLTNICDLRSRVKIKLISKVVSIFVENSDDKLVGGDLTENWFELEARTTKVLVVYFVARKVNLNYEKIVRFESVSCNNNLVIRASNMDSHHIIYHSLFYKLISRSKRFEQEVLQGQKNKEKIPAGTNLTEVDFGEIVYKSPCLRSFEVQNITDKQLKLRFSTSTADLQCFVLDPLLARPSSSTQSEDTRWRRRKQISASFDESAFESRPQSSTPTDARSREHTQSVNTRNDAQSLGGEENAPNAPKDSQAHETEEQSVNHALLAIGISTLGGERGTTVTASGSGSFSVKRTSSSGFEDSSNYPRTIFEDATEGEHTTELATQASSPQLGSVSQRLQKFNSTRRGSSEFDSDGHTSSFDATFDSQIAGSPQLGPKKHSFDNLLSKTVESTPEGSKGRRRDFRTPRRKDSSFSIDAESELDSSLLLFSSESHPSSPTVEHTRRTAESGSFSSVSSSFPTSKIGAPSTVSSSSKVVKSEIASDATRHTRESSFNSLSGTESPTLLHQDVQPSAARNLPTPDLHSNESEQQQQGNVLDGTEGKVEEWDLLCDEFEKPQKIYFSGMEPKEETTIVKQTEHRIAALRESLSGAEPLNELVLEPQQSVRIGAVLYLAQQHQAEEVVSSEPGMTGKLRLMTEHIWVEQLDLDEEDMEKVRQIHHWGRVSSKDEEDVKMERRAIPVVAKIARSTMSFAQRHINFGTVKLPCHRYVKTLYLNNESALPLLYKIRKSGSFSSGFLRIVRNPVGMVRPFGTKEVKFEFYPTMPGLINEKVIVCNIMDSSRSMDIMIKANVVRPKRFKVDNTQLNFVCQKRSSNVQVVSIRNTYHKQREFAIKLKGSIDPFRLRFSSFASSSRIPKEVGEEIEYLQHKYRIAETKNQVKKLKAIRAQLDALYEQKSKIKEDRTRLVPLPSGGAKLEIPAEATAKIQLQAYLNDVSVVQEDSKAEGLLHIFQVKNKDAVIEVPLTLEYLPQHELAAVGETLKLDEQVIHEVTSSSPEPVERLPTPRRLSFSERLATLAPLQDLDALRAVTALPPSLLPSSSTASTASSSSSVHSDTEPPVSPQSAPGAATDAPLLAPVPILATQDQQQRPRPSTGTPTKYGTSRRKTYQKDATMGTPERFRSLQYRSTSPSSSHAEVVNGEKTGQGTGTRGMAITKRLIDFDVSPKMLDFGAVFVDSEDLEAELIITNRSKSHARPCTFSVSVGGKDSVVENVDIEFSETVKVKIKIDREHGGRRTQAIKVECKCASGATLSKNVIAKYNILHVHFLDLDAELSGLPRVLDFGDCYISPSCPEIAPLPLRFKNVFHKRLVVSAQSNLKRQISVFADREKTIPMENIELDPEAVVTCWVFVDPVLLRENSRVINGGIQVYMDGEFTCTVRVKATAGISEWSLNRDCVHLGVVKPGALSWFSVIVHNLTKKLPLRYRLTTFEHDPLILSPQFLDSEDSQQSLLREREVAPQGEELLGFSATLRDSTHDGKKFAGFFRRDFRIENLITNEEKSFGVDLVVASGEDQTCETMFLESTLPPTYLDSTNVVHRGGCWNVHTVHNLSKEKSLFARLKWLGKEEEERYFQWSFNGVDGPLDLNIPPSGSAQVFVKVREGLALPHEKDLEAMVGVEVESIVRQVFCLRSPRRKLVIKLSRDALSFGKLLSGSSATESVSIENAEPDLELSLHVEDLNKQCCTVQTTVDKLDGKHVINVTLEAKEVMDVEGEIPASFVVQAVLVVENKLNPDDVRHIQLKGVVYQSMISVPSSVLLPPLFVPAPAKEEPLTCNSWFTVTNVYDEPLSCSIEAHVHKDWEEVVKVSVLLRVSNVEVSKLALTERESKDVRVAVIPIQSARLPMGDFSNVRLGTVTFRCSSREHEVALMGTLVAGKTLALSTSKLVFFTNKVGPDTFEVSRKSADEGFWVRNLSLRTSLTVSLETHPIDLQGERLLLGGSKNQQQSKDKARGEPQPSAKDEAVADVGGKKGEEEGYQDQAERIEEEGEKESAKEGEGDIASYRYVIPAFEEATISVEPDKSVFVPVRLMPFVPSIAGSFGASKSNESDAAEDVVASAVSGSKKRTCEIRVIDVNSPNSEESIAVSVHPDSSEKDPEEELARSSLSPVEGLVGGSLLIGNTGAETSGGNEVRFGDSGLDDEVARGISEMDENDDTRSQKSTRSILPFEHDTEDETRSISSLAAGSDHDTSSVPEVKWTVESTDVYAAPLSSSSMSLGSTSRSSSITGPASMPTQPLPPPPPLEESLSSGKSAGSLQSKGKAVSNLALRGCTPISGSTSRFEVDVGQREFSSGPAEWEIILENTGRGSLEYELFLVDSSDKQWLELSRTSGVLDAAHDFHSVMLRLSTDQFGSFSTYVLVLESKTLAIKVIRVSMEVVVTSSSLAAAITFAGSTSNTVPTQQSVFAVSVAGVDLVESGESAVINMGTTVLGWNVSHFSFIVKNESRLPLSFIFSHSAPDKLPVRFSLEPGSTASLQKVTVAPQCQQRVYLGITPTLALNEESDGVGVTVSCDFIKDYSLGIKLVGKCIRPSLCVFRRNLDTDGGGGFDLDKAESETASVKSSQSVGVLDDGRARQVLELDFGPGGSPARSRHSVVIQNIHPNDHVRVLLSSSCSSVFTLDVVGSFELAPGASRVVVISLNPDKVAPKVSSNKDGSRGGVQYAMGHVIISCSHGSVYERKHLVLHYSASSALAYHRGGLVSADRFLLEEQIVAWLEYVFFSLEDPHGDVSYVSVQLMVLNDILMYLVSRVNPSRTVYGLALLLFGSANVLAMSSAPSLSAPPPTSSTSASTTSSTVPPGQPSSSVTPWGSNGVLDRIYATWKRQLERFASCIPHREPQIASLRRQLES